MDNPTPSSATMMYSPSEIALFHGEQFVPGAPFLDKTKQLLIDQNREQEEFKAALLRIALLCSEASGSIKLEVRSVTRGPDSLTSVYAMPGEFEAAWPMHSLEAALDKLVRKDEESDIINLCDAAIGDEDHDWTKVITLVKNGLVQRGIFNTTIEKRFLGSRTTYTMAPGMAATIQSNTVADIKAVLTEVETNRSELWEALNADLTDGFIEEEEEEEDYEE